MKTVAIVGSPRKDGNCDILVNKVLEKIDGEKSIYYLNELDIGFCKACHHSRLQRFHSVYMGLSCGSYNNCFA